jgi:NAD-dependent deacetylase
MSQVRLFILTGAGISAESGLGTFRDKDGLWTRYNLAEVASLDGYRRNPQRVLDFYNARRANLDGASPNPAHHALVRLQRAFHAAGNGCFLCTQNVDDLHEQAGAVDVAHMHGELRKKRCGACDAISPCEEDINLTAACDRCGRAGALRPHIVWFGEMPLHLDQIYQHLELADVFIAIGTSGAVYPAAGFVEEARAHGIKTAELNLEPSDNAYLFDERRYGLASVIVPQWVDEMIAALPGG